MEKILLKILRSIVTSLLFVSLMVIIIIQIFFTVQEFQKKSLMENIDSQMLLESVINDKIDDIEVNQLALNYIDDYLDYIFNKKSYPSTQSVKFDSLNETNLEYGKSTISSLKGIIDLDYDDVITLRNLNKYTSNRSIYLIINSSVILLVILIILIKMNFKDGIKISLIAVVSGGIVSTILGLLTTFIIEISTSTVMQQFLKCILNKTFIQNFSICSLIYIFISSLILILIYFFDRYKKLKK